METDNVMPNDGTYFSAKEPESQEIERNKEKAETLQALPILRGLLARYEHHIAELDSVTSMPDDVKKDPTAFMNAHNAREIAVGYMRIEKEYIEGLLETHAPSS